VLPIKKIVCPTDFSDPAYEGLKAATEMAEHFQAELILVNVISPVPVVSGAAPIGFHLPTVMSEMQAAAEKSMTNLISKRVPKAVQTRSIIIQGKPADEIVKLADEDD
jgi:nucleotide-binding universal stress UspA family protein